MWGKEVNRRIKSMDRSCKSVVVEAPANSLQRINRNTRGKAKCVIKEGGHAKSSGEPKTWRKRTKDRTGLWAAHSQLSCPYSLSSHSPCWEWMSLGRVSFSLRAEGSNQEGREGGHRRCCSWVHQYCQWGYKSGLVCLLQVHLEWLKYFRWKYLWFLGNKWPKNHS